MEAHAGVNEPRQICRGVFQRQHTNLGCLSSLRYDEHVRVSGYLHLIVVKHALEVWHVERIFV